MAQKDKSKEDLLGRKKRSWLALTSVVAVIVALAVLLVIYLSGFFADDDAQRFTGAQREVALRAIKAQNASFSNPTIGNIIKRYSVHVDNVYPTSSADADKYCTARGVNKSDDTQSAQYYSVDVTVRQLLGSTQQRTYDGCYLMNHEPDGHDLSRH